MGTHRSSHPQEQKAGRQEISDKLGDISGLGNVHEKVNDFGEDDDESGDNSEHDDEKR